MILYKNELEKTYVSPSSSGSTSSSRDFFSKHIIAFSTSFESVDSFKRSEAFIIGMFNVGQGAILRGGFLAILL